MPEGWTSLLGILKLSPRTSLAAGITLLVLALIPVSSWSYVGIASLPGPIRGCGAIGGLFLTLFGTLGFTMPALGATWQRRRLRMTRIGQLVGLSKPEREIIARFLQEDTSSLGFGLKDGVASGLIAQGILYWPINALDVHGRNPCNIQPWVRELALTDKRVRAALSIAGGTGTRVEAGRA